MSQSQADQTISLLSELLAKMGQQLELMQRVNSCLLGLFAALLALVFFSAMKAVRR